MKRIAIPILTLVIGLATGVMIARSYLPNSSGFHWRRIAEYQKYARDPSNYEHQGRFTVTKSEPPDIGPSLEALTTSGEIIKKQIIIPGLPLIPPHVKRWMTFADDPAILHASGPGNFHKGEIPLMFTLWYRPEATERVDKLVNEFTTMAQENSTNQQPKAEQPGPAQPATKPADKVPAEVQPSPPTSKVSPR